MEGGSALFVQVIRAFGGLSPLLYRIHGKLDKFITMYLPKI